MADEFQLADLRQADAAQQATEGMDWVFALAADIRLSQKRRLFVRRAHAKGLKPAWDHLPAGTDDPNWRLVATGE